MDDLKVKNINPRKLRVTLGIPLPKNLYKATNIFPPTIESQDMPSPCKNEI